MRGGLCSIQSMAGIGPGIKLPQSDWLYECRSRRRDKYFGNPGHVTPIARRVVILRYERLGDKFPGHERSDSLARPSHIVGFKEEAGAQLLTVIGFKFGEYRLSRDYSVHGFYC